MYQINTSTQSVQINIIQLDLLHVTMSPSFFPSSVQKSWKTVERQWDHKYWLKLLSWDTKGTKIYFEENQVIKSKTCHRGGQAH